MLTSQLKKRESTTEYKKQHQDREPLQHHLNHPVFVTRNPEHQAHQESLLADHLLMTLQ